MNSLKEAYRWPMSPAATGKNGPTVSGIGLGCMGMSRLLRPGRRRARRSPPSTAPSISASTSSTPPTCTARSRTSELVGRAIRDRRDDVVVATKFGNVRDDGRRLPRHQRHARIRARGLRRVAAAARRRHHRPLLPAPRRSEHADRGHRRRDGRARQGRARCATSGCPRPRPRRSAARTRCIRSRRCRPNIRCGAAIRKTSCCRRAASWASASSPTVRSAAASSPAASDRSTICPPDDWRRNNPRFQGDNFQKNLELVAAVEELARAQGLHAGAARAGWLLLAQGDDVVRSPARRPSGSRKTPRRLRRPADAGGHRFAGSAGADGGR